MRAKILSPVLVVAFLASLSIPTAATEPGSPTGGADTVLRHGYVYTVNEKNPVAEALAIEDGVITYVGKDRGVRGFIGPETRVIDLDGRMVMPGLQDGHIHGITVGAPQCDLEYAPLTVEELLSRLDACLQNPEYGWGEENWLVVDHWYAQFLRPPDAKVSKETLDSLDTQRPIVIYSVWGHAALANSRALELAGITAKTPDPPDGVIGRNENGEPNGWLYDGAQSLLREVEPPAPQVDPVVEARRGMKALNRAGLTSFYAQGKGRQTVETFGQLRDQGGLTARAHFGIGADPAAGKDLSNLIERLDAMRADLERSDQIPLQVRAWRPGRQRGPRLVPEPGVSVDGIAELSLDGISQYPAQTAALLKPYRINVGTEDNPKWVPGDNRGKLYIEPEVFTEMAKRLERAGYQIQTHAIGSRAVRVALDGFEAMREDGRSRHSHTPGLGRKLDSRPSISHAEIVHPDDVGRFARLGVIPVMSYQWAKPGPDSTTGVKPYLGPKRWDWYEPEGKLHAAGAKIAFGSDYPTDPLDYFSAIEVAVLREADWGPDFPEYAGKLNADPGLTLPAAIRGITINAAYAMHQDRVTGSLERGKLADLIVLDQNLFKVPTDDISETSVLMTMVGGDVVYTSGDLATRCVGEGGAVTVHGDLFVPRGRSCTLTGTTVTGDIRVARGANLIARNVTIGGQISSASDAYVETHNSTVGGQIALRGAYGSYLDRTEVGGRVVTRPAKHATNAGFVYTFKADIAGNVRSSSGEISVDSSEVGGAVNSRASLYTDIYQSFIDGRVVVRNNKFGSVVCASAIDGKSRFGINASVVQLGTGGPFAECDNGNYWGDNVTVNGTAGRVYIDHNIFNGDLTLRNNDPIALFGGSNTVRGTINGEYKEWDGSASKRQRPSASPNSASNRPDTLKDKIEQRRTAALKGADRAGDANLDR